jgi:trans-2-enoyl-CoA reductase
MLDILKKVIKNVNYNPENFNRLYRESISKHWDDESNFDEEDWVAMRILELEKSTIDNIERELHNIQYELHELKYHDLPYAELEMYEAEDEESKEVLKGKIIEMEKRIQELEIRKKQLLIMFCKFARNLAEKYLFNG